jgi:hypothetical protein
MRFVQILCAAFWLPLILTTASTAQTAQDHNASGGPRDRVEKITGPLTSPVVREPVATPVPSTSTVTSPPPSKTK